MRASVAIVCLAVFASVFAADVGYHAWREHRVAAQWVAVESSARPGAWARYIERQDYYLGYSYGLAAAFTAFALLRSIRDRRRQMRGVVGGLTLTGSLYAAGCYVVGCCGSPMLGVYLSLFGTSVLGLLKPIVAGVTTLSVLLGGLVVLRRSHRACCAADALCDEVLPSSPATRPEHASGIDEFEKLEQVRASAHEDVQPAAQERHGVDAGAPEME